ncbi:hypothetical protein CAPTEDRAFT_119661 [Capitella teleta]|uniref:Carbohydrate sulfotransferase n=1 Tax=Capitella teleta TaxID=283909 RepID=R7V3K5_CAPTE|nr:hypothetical protein CAPTEDRAFT_119661 [Capitella teleta]|eukprot:ELU13124.1 hypothetical protein CAPTEDRAFT_119661 [Capitella teleta]
MESNQTEEKVNQEDARPSEVCSNERRLVNIKAKCEKHPELAKLTGFQAHLKVDPKNKVLFCLVRKAGSTSVHNLMHMALTGTYLDDPENCGEDCWQASGILPLSRYDDRQKKEILGSYHKIIVVRHPFERYLSCWVNKFKFPGVPVNMDYEKEVQSWMNITQIQALNFSDEIRAELAKEMTLSELTKLVDLYEREKLRHDSHWRQMYQVCQPCAIQYDYMVRVETMQFDSNHILQKLNLTEENFPQLNHHRSTSGYKLEKDLPDFSSVPSDVMDTLHKLYQTDLDMFGYSFDKSTFTAKCDGFEANDHHCC